MQTFTKAERLSSKVAIDKLFETGKSFHNTPFKVFWLEANESKVAAQIVISIPKRLFKRSVDRNRLKRLVRETYRKNKNILFEKIENRKVLLMFIYTSKTMMEFKEIEDTMVVLLQRLSKNVNPEL